MLKYWWRAFIAGELSKQDHLVRKSTPSFTKSSHVVFIKPIIKETQPFKICKIYLEMYSCPDIFVNFCFEWLHLIQYEFGSIIINFGYFVNCSI